MPQRARSLVSARQSGGSGSGRAHRETLRKRAKYAVSRHHLWTETRSECRCDPSPKAPHAEVGASRVVRSAPATDAARPRRHLVRHEKAGQTYRLTCLSGTGRGDRIRTCDHLVPNQARYRTALHPVSCKVSDFASAKVLIKSEPCKFFYNYLFKKQIISQTLLRETLWLSKRPFNKQLFKP